LGIELALSSMTGFARASGATGKLQWLWDVKSVNGKALEIRLRLPPGLDYLETQARVILGQMFKRGNLQASLTLSASSQVAPVRINEAVLEEYLAIAEKLKSRLGATSLQPEALLALRGVAEQVESAVDEKEINERDSAMLETLTAAGKDLLKARRDEGARLRKVLEAQVERIGTLVQDAKANPSRKPEVIRARLAEQVKKLIEASASFDSDRLHQEAALLATRNDIQEELDRLESHLGAARDLIKSSEPVGRKFDFLAQEFNREVNTLCSKSNDVALTGIGLELKAVVDQLREQIQNIE
jgi:uncharacterized protein (TIGR00255 family)